VFDVMLHGAERVMLLDLQKLGGRKMPGGIRQGTREISGSLWTLLHMRRADAACALKFHPDPI